MSTPTNRITRLSGQAASVFPDAVKVIDSTTSWNQGDLLRFDEAANLLKPIALEAEASTFVGIADCTLVLGKPKSPYQGTAVDASQGVVPVVGGVHGVVAKLTAKTGDAFNPGDLVFAVAADPQQVSSAGTKAIGVYLGGVIAAATAGQQVECKLGHRFPGDTLVM